MPRSDPPPTKKLEPLRGPRYQSSPPDEDIDLETEIVLGDDELKFSDDELRFSDEELAPQKSEFGDVEITTGEGEIALDELDEEGDVQEGDDPCPSPFERITIAPDVSEREYVARMMREAPLSDPVPPSRAVTPPPPRPAAVPGTSPTGSLTLSFDHGDSVDSISSWPSPPTNTDGPLTLDLEESALPPVAVPRISSVPVTMATDPPVALPTGQPVTIGSDPPVMLSSDPPVTFASDPPQPSISEAPTGVRERSVIASAFPDEVDLPSPSPAGDADAGESRPRNGAPLSFKPAAGDALELVGVRAQSVRPPPASQSITMRAVRDRFDVGDFSGALILAEGILEHDPESVDALLYAEHCRDVLKQMYISRLGGVGRVPQVAVSDEQLRWLSLDHRAGFLLSLVDGRSSFEEVLDMSGMPPIDALRLLLELLQQNVIKVA